MLRQDPQVAERLTATVKAIEAHTTAELVLVVAGRSDEYREAPLLAGALAGWATLAFLAWSPVVFGGAWFPVDVALAAVLTAFLVARSPRALRRLTGAARRAAAVDLAARSAFVEEAVAGTRARTGVLVYVSVLEEEVRVLPDEALLGRVPPARWAEVRLAATDLDGFVAGLEAFGKQLAAWLPAEGENPDEIPDAPRFR